MRRWDVTEVSIKARRRVVGIDICHCVYVQKCCRLSARRLRIFAVFIMFSFYFYYSILLFSFYGVVHV